MSISLADIHALKKKSELERRKLDELEQALRIVEDKLRENDTAQVQLDLKGGATLRRTGFTAAVRDAVLQYKNTSFTVKDIELFVRNQDVQMPPKSVRPRIAMILQKMVEEKAIKVMVEGSGNKPNVYQLAKK